MVNNELVEIIKLRYQEGQRRSEIRAALLEEGYEETEIDGAIAHIQYEAIKQLPVVSRVYQVFENLDSKTAHSSPKLVATVLLSCFGVLLLLFGGFYYVLDPLGVRTLERDKIREADVIRVRTAIDTYYADKKLYPVSLQGLLPNYLKAIPLDPKTGEMYQYTTYDANKIYKLCISFEVQPVECISSSPNTSSIPQVIVSPTSADQQRIELTPAMIGSPSATPISSGEASLAL
ncbi:MAG: hypothetical protein H0W89_06960 [Candidatus Levybacteria bacterium]|nr:hypothetical protein [Candidatus Levybacteria bacterium]